MEPAQREGKAAGGRRISAPLHRAVEIYLHLFLRQVTEEVLSILRLLTPLTEPELRSHELPPKGENPLDAALAQLQNVARQLAISNTKQVNIHLHSNKAPCSYDITVISV